MVAVTLTACGKSTQSGSEPKTQPPVAVKLQSFEAEVTQGEGHTLDFSPYVETTADWTLKSVVDTSGRLSALTLSKRSATLTSQDSGVIPLTWTISANNREYSAELKLSVTPSQSANTDPEVREIAITTTANQPVSTDLTPYLYDADGDKVTITKLEQSGQRFALDGMTVVYTPEPEFLGEDSATITVSDGRGGSATGTIQVSVKSNGSSNAPPTTKPHQFEIEYGATEIIDLSTLASDPDGDELTVTAITSTLDNAINITGKLTFQYTASHATDADQLRYTVSDGKGGNAESTIDVNILLPDEVAELTAASVTLPDSEMDGPTLTVDLSDYVSHSEGLALTLDKIEGARFGDTDISENSLTFTYTPSNIRFGQDQFRYVVRDPAGLTTSGRVTINIKAPPALEITGLELNADEGITATLTCEHCDLSQSSYQFLVQDKAVGEASLSNHYTASAEDLRQGVSVIVNARNRYCAMEQSNACQSRKAKAVAMLPKVERVFNTLGAFAAELDSGAIVAWGEPLQGGDNRAVQDTLKPVSEIYASQLAFAALHQDGTVVTWGSGAAADSSSVATQLTDIASIAPGWHAFAAIDASGNVVTWGHDAYGGDSSSVQAELTTVKSLHSTGRAFAALKQDGSVVTWGDVRFGGDTRLADQSLNSVKTLYANSGAFAALTENGEVITWGDRRTGGDSRTLKNELTNIDRVIATPRAFAAIRLNGSVVVWGDPSSGGDASAVQSQLLGIRDISASARAFAAIKSDRTIVTWGDPRYGGNSQAVQNQLTNVQSIAATDYAFAALKSDGEVVTWGSEANGAGSVPIERKDIVEIAATSRAFAALNAQGRVVPWGDFGSGGNWTHSELAETKIRSLFSNELAFAAITEHGGLLTWGSGHNGGDSSQVQDLLSEMTVIEQDLNYQPE
ncbi:cadherin-like domain-containing protein [Marinobacter hydrocarbonoclasticus]|nr:cadherin-like domain-containing protein [Marinobacter nauticus]